MKNYDITIKIFCINTQMQISIIIIIHFIYNCVVRLVKIVKENIFKLSYMLRTPPSKIIEKAQLLSISYDIIYKEDNDGKKYTSNDIHSYIYVYYCAKREEKKHIYMNFFGRLPNQVDQKFVLQIRMRYTNKFFNII